MFLKRFIPDITFNGSTREQRCCFYEIKNNPGASFNETTQATTQGLPRAPLGSLQKN